jgi:hypothetical protein
MENHSFQRDVNEVDQASAIHQRSDKSRTKVNEEYAANNGAQKR